MIGLTPKDNELRMQVGFKLTHEAEHRLYVADKDGNWMCPMEALKELLTLVRVDEREKLAKPDPVVSFTDNEEGLWIQLECNGSYYSQNLSESKTAKFFVDAYRKKK